MSILTIQNLTYTQLKTDSKQRLKTDEDSSMEWNVLWLPVVLFKLQSVAIKTGREGINCQTVGFKEGRESIVRPLGLRKGGNQLSDYWV